MGARVFPRMLGAMAASERPEWAERMRCERVARGWSQSDAVRALRRSSSVVLPTSLLDQWKRWERGRNRPDAFYRPLIAAMFDLAVESLFGGARPVPVGHDACQSATGLETGEWEDPVKRRTALGIGLASTVSPAAVTDVLQESAAEAFEYTRERAVSAVGSGTLEQLTSAVAELDGDYGWRSAAELFPLAHGYRRRVESLINGRHTLSEGRELYVHGAYLSQILADLAADLGSTLTAKAFAIDSYHLAHEAGHDELCAWAADSHAAVMLYTAQPGEATVIALKGLDRVPHRHPLAARLCARAAEGYARQGNQAACVELLTQARTVCETLPEEMPSRFATDRAEHVWYSIATYAASCYARLGAWNEAEQQARSAAGVARWSPHRAAMAQLDLGIALANLGSADEAAEQGKQALAFGRSYGMFQVSRARELNTALMRRYPKEPGAIEFYERYEVAMSRLQLTQ